MRRIDENKTNRSRIFPGLAAQKIQWQTDIEKKQKNELTETRDSSNRKYIRKKIVEYIKGGLSKQEIVEKILKDPIINEFEYLTKSGTKIDVFINNWTEDAIKKENSKDENAR